MESLLKRQLARIKARALRIRDRRRDDDTDGRAIVDEMVAAGAVTRGADFIPRPLQRRWPWRRDRDDGPGVVEILERYKTGEPRPIEVVAPGRVLTPDGHATYVITARGREVDPAAAVEAGRFAGMTHWPAEVDYRRTGYTHPRRRRGAEQETPPLHPNRVLFLDIETCGLSANTYLFLCGLMYLESGEWVVEQVFARDYSEETGLLRHVRDTMNRFDVVVTYNGVSFDLPFIRTRMNVHRIQNARPMGSVDLLYTTRRVFRGILPNRRLVTVERHLRRVDREGDIPGRYIPYAYHDFVRTGDARVMLNVLYHNRMDLFTMAVILTHLSH